jgi:uncharacterized caspase-like protein
MLCVRGGMRGQHLLAGLLALISLSLPAWAQKRVALVIGNSVYVKAPELPNPRNDAVGMADLLRKAGFDVNAKLDLGVDAKRRALRDFSDQVRDADIAVVFYAGHGMEMNGVNYLIPIDATIARDVDVEDEAVSLDRVIRTLEPARYLQLVILDSCRDNPFVRSMRRTIVSRSVRSGHGDIDERALPPNTLIAYAQRAGATAEDGDGANSPYTTALLKHLATPGLDVELALRRVRDEVLKNTRNRQEPFKYGSLGGAELPLVPGATSASAPESTAPSLAPPRLGEAAEMWALVKDTRDIRALETFRRQYGTSNALLDQLAGSRIAELKREVSAVVPPIGPAPPSHTASEAEVQHLALLRQGEEKKRLQACKDLVFVGTSHLGDDKPISIQRQAITELEQAVEACDSSSAKNGWRFKAHNNLGVAYAMLGQWEDARKHFHGAIDLSQGFQGDHQAIPYEGLAYVGANRNPGLIWNAEARTSFGKVKQLCLSCYRDIPKIPNKGPLQIWQINADTKLPGDE